MSAASSPTRRSWCGSSRRSIRPCAASISRQLPPRAGRAGVISVIDNTFASPVNQQPIALGVDLVMHSATKYLNGHSDVTAGALAGPARLIAPIEKARRLIGGILDAHAAYALGRGIKTLHVRVERHNANAMAVADLAVQGFAGRARLLPGARVASRSRVGPQADAGFRRHGVR